jgi:L-amino acid N-acyltransferase YncA
MITYSLALHKDLATLKTFLFKHGSNPRNHLPGDGVDKEFALITEGKASVIVATDNSALLGFGIFYHPQALPNKYLQFSGLHQTIYIAEAVVHQAHVGQGIGHKLLTEIINQATKFGASMLIVDRHEQNLASAGMMRKAGFIELATFDDPHRRDMGSRKTTVMGYTLKSSEAQPVLL